MNQTSDYAGLIGDMYARWTLDCVVEIAYAVSKDFILRPEFYKADAVPDNIVTFRIEYGNTAAFPNQAQRQEMNSPILGASDGYQVDSTPVVSGTPTKDVIPAGGFRPLRKPLFDACTVFSERSVVDAALAMRQAIVSAQKLFQPYLSSFDGASIRQSYKKLVSISNLAFELLRSPGIAHVFGLTPPAENWPLESNDSNGALLIGAIGEKLQLPSQYVLNSEKFQRLRRVAQEGRNALQAILVGEDVSRDQLDGLINSVYTWAIALRDYGQSSSPSIARTTSRGPS